MGISVVPLVNASIKRPLGTLRISNCILWDTELYTEIFQVVAFPGLRGMGPGLMALIIWLLDNISVMFRVAIIWFLDVELAVSLNG